MNPDDAHLLVQALIGFINMLTNMLPVALGAGGGGWLVHFGHKNAASDGPQKPNAQ